MRHGSQQSTLDVPFTRRNVKALARFLPCTCEGGQELPNMQSRTMLANCPLKNSRDNHIVCADLHDNVG